MTAQLDRAEDFKRTPQGWQQRWQAELTAATRAAEKWYKRGNVAVERFLDQRGATDSLGGIRLNLFHANVTTLMSMLYGNLPKVEVSRRYHDPADDAARVAAEILERMLNNDVARNGYEYDTVLRGVLEDRLLPGLGCARVRYEVTTKQVEVAPGVVTEQLDRESVHADYYHWRDVCWPFARNWTELRWVAFRSYMTHDQAEKRFGKQKADQMQYAAVTIPETKDAPQDPDEQSAWNKAEIWEIWCDEYKTVYWYSASCQEILDEKPDPLGLAGFYPCPPFFMANVTTSNYAPVPDYYLAQDLYLEIDALESRIVRITTAIKAVGVYDAAATGVQRMLSEGVDNQLIPVDNYAVFAEKGGLAGAIVWMPIKDLVDVVAKLIDLRNDAINLLYQATGLSDILRGAAGEARVSATEQSLKAKFASVRVQALQDEFARFASDLLQLKAEVISLHFDPQSILRQANMKFSMDDMPHVMAAIQLIKQPVDVAFRVQIRPESVAMIDYAQLRQERGEYITSLATFLQSSAPLAQLSADAVPVLLELLKWGLAGFKGSQEIEGVLDKAISGMQERLSQPQPPKPDPKAEAEKAKAQAAVQKSQMDMQLSQQKVQGDLAVQRAQTQGDLQVIKADTMSELLKTGAKALTTHQQSQARTKAHRESMESKSKEPSEAE